MVRVVPARVYEPMILIDWSDLESDQSRRRMRLAAGGRRRLVTPALVMPAPYGHNAIYRDYLSGLQNLGDIPIIAPPPDDHGKGNHNGQSEHHQRYL